MIDNTVPGRPVGGRRQPSFAQALRLGAFLTGVLPPVPPSVDDTLGVVFGLDKNSEYGDCVPTGFDNFRRLVTWLLTGAEVDTGWAQVVAWYRTQNPDFDENDPGGPGDQGMDMRLFLTYLVKQGVILGFATLDPRNQAEVRAALYLFLGVYLGVNLQVAQQSQTDTGRWDYEPGSPDWGGHCVVGAAYGADGTMTVVTWQELVAVTPAWMDHCLEEGFVVLLREHVEHPAFRAGFDLPKFARAFQELTGRPFPVPVTPAPAPLPVGGPSALDIAFAQVLRADGWVDKHHIGDNEHVARAAHAWLDGQGL